MSLPVEGPSLAQEPLIPSAPLEHLLIRRGSTCPRCSKGVMDYNGMLDLECMDCGFSLVEAVGCS